MYSPSRRAALAKAKMGDGMYWCLLCSKPQEKWAMDVDHIEACGSLLGYTDTEGFIRRLFEGELQAICKPCHLLKRKARPK